MPSSSAAASGARRPVTCVSTTAFSGGTRTAAAVNRLSSPRLSPRAAMCRSGTATCRAGAACWAASATSAWTRCSSIRSAAITISGAKAGGGTARASYGHSDSTTSPCIDAGNPGWPLGNEPQTIPDDPNSTPVGNKRIDMGAFGGTSEASIAPSGRALLADVDNDGAVNWRGLRPHGGRLDADRGEMRDGPDAGRTHEWGGPGPSGRRVATLSGRGTHKTMYKPDVPSIRIVCRR